MPLRYAASSPPQLSGSLHRLAKEQFHRPPGFLSGYAYQNGKCEHRSDYPQEEDLVRGICGAHGSHETAKVRGVRTTGGERGLRGRAGKRVNGVFPGRPQSFRYQRRPVDDCRPGRRVIAQDDRTRGGTFHDEMDRCRESQGWSTACSSMPERDGGRTKERIARSKRACAG